jgi:hypothetical protein
MAEVPPLPECAEVGRVDKEHVGCGGQLHAPYVPTFALAEIKPLELGAVHGSSVASTQDRASRCWGRPGPRLASPNVYLFFDESGDYAFPEDRFDCYVQAALVSPESTLAAIDDFVHERKREWEIDELHAVDLEPAQLLAVAEFIGHSDCQLLAHATDNVLVSPAGIAQFRLDQAARLERNLEWYRTESTKAIGAPVKEIEDWYLRHIKRAGLATQISHGEFVQAHYLVELIADALQKALIVFHEDQWSGDFRDFQFILDGKLPQKMAAGEKYLNDSIVPALGSRPNRGLAISESWKGDPPHPFVEKFGLERGRIRGQDVEGAFDLKLLFEHGLRFEPSAAHSGLQLVDAVAYIVRRAVMEPDDTTIQAAYDAFREKLRNDEGNCITIHRLRVGDEDRSSLDRYRPLYGRTR